MLMFQSLNEFTPVQVPLCEYERIRATNIKEKELVWATLGMEDELEVTSSSPGVSICHLTSIKTIEIEMSKHWINLDQLKSEVSGTNRDP